MTPEQKQLWFDQALKHGFIDQKYGTFDQLNTVLKWLRGSGLGDADIRKLLGFQTDNPVIKKGQIYGRGIRESISPSARADMDAVLGEGTAQRVEKYLRAKWAKARKLLTLDDVRTNKWSDLGHFIEGSLKDPDAAAGENAILNRKAGSEGERPERFPTDVVEEMFPVTPDQQAWDAAAQQVTGDMPTPWGRQQVPIRDATQASQLSFPQDVAELADNGFIKPEQLAPLARQLEALDPTQRRAVVENIKATGQVDLNINPDSYKTADLTAENGSGKVTQLYQDVNGHTDIEAQRKRLQEKYNGNNQLVARNGDTDKYTRELPGGGVARRTEKGMEITFSNGRRRIFQGIDQWDIIESFANPRSGYELGRGNIGGAAVAAGEEFAGSLQAMASPEGLAMIGLGMVAPVPSILFGGIQTIQGGVRAAGYFQAAREGLTFEQAQDRELEQMLEAEEKEYQRQIEFDKQSQELGQTLLKMQASR